MTEPITGGCQCGAVRYRAETELTNPHLCHCRMCQKAAGNYFMPLAGAPRERIVVPRGEPGWFHSSDIVRRGFCRDCGTPLFFDPLDSEGLAGLDADIARTIDKNVAGRIDSADQRYVGG